MAQHQSNNRPPGPGQFLLRLGGMAVGLLVFVGSIILGGFLLAALLGFALIVAMVFYARIWWLRRKMSARRNGHGDTFEGEIIETEYRVVRRADDADKDG